MIAMELEWVSNAEFAALEAAISAAEEESAAAKAAGRKYLRTRERSAGSLCASASQSGSGIGSMLVGAERDGTEKEGTSVLTMDIEDLRPRSVSINPVATCHDLGGRGVGGRGKAADDGVSRLQTFEEQRCLKKRDLGLKMAMVGGGLQTGGAALIKCEASSSIMADVDSGSVLEAVMAEERAAGNEGGVGGEDGHGGLKRSEACLQALTATGYGAIVLREKEDGCSMIEHESSGQCKVISSLVQSSSFGANGPVDESGGSGPDSMGEVRVLGSCGSEASGDQVPNPVLRDESVLGVASQTSEVPRSGPGPGSGLTSGLGSGSGSGSSTQGWRTIPLRHRGGRLSVTDLTASEWCEMQVNFSLEKGAPEPTPVMVAGSTRHAQLEAEVVEHKEVNIKTREDSWAVRLLNTVMGINGLLANGMMREVYILGEVDGVWMAGIIDEIRMINGGRPRLIDTKTRRKPTLPAEAQKRTTRVQLMCYKVLLDSLIRGRFPAESFYRNFRLRRSRKLCKDVQDFAQQCGLGNEVKQLGDVVMSFLNMCQTLPQTEENLLVRYEWQKDHSLIAEESFSFEEEWIRGRISWLLRYWKGLRKPNPVARDEVWKCNYCPFEEICPIPKAAQETERERRHTK